MGGRGGKEGEGWRSGSEEWGHGIRQEGGAERGSKEKEGEEGGRDEGGHTHFFKVTSRFHEKRLAFKGNVSLLEVTSRFQ